MVTNSENSQHTRIVWNQYCVHYAVLCTIPNWKKHLSWMHILWGAIKKTPEVFILHRALAGIWSPAMKIKMTVILFSCQSPSGFYTAPPDPVPWLLWEALHKTCPYIPAPALELGGRGHCAMFLQILTRKWEKLCSTIKPERAARSGAQQSVCFPSGWVQQSVLQLGTKLAPSALNQSWWTWLQNNASFELCQIPTDCCWPKQHLNNPLE